MVILHIAAIENDPCSGVCVVVPQHVLSQSKFAKVAFINIKNIPIDGLSCQLPYEKNFDIRTLSAPFSAPDLVVFHEVYYPPYLKIAHNLKQNHIPYVMIPHGSLTAEAQKKKWLKKKTANLLLFNAFINSARAIQCLSNAELCTTAHIKTKFVGTNGISLPQVRKTSFSDKVTHFAYIGRLDVFHKGLDLLLAAIGEFQDYLREKHCKFFIFGPDHNGEYNRIQKLTKQNGIEDLVALSGEITGISKEQALLNADLFIQTSRFEGMPMGLLEAMSYGLPVLITEGTGLGQYVHDYNAGWVAETTVESIADAIKQAVEDRNHWNQESENAITLIQENFRWERVSAATIQEYHKILS